MGNWAIRHLGREGMGSRSHAKPPRAQKRNGSGLVVVISAGKRFANPQPVIPDFGSPALRNEDRPVLRHLARATPGEPQEGDSI